MAQAGEQIVERADEGLYFARKIALRQRLERSRNVMVESNSVLKFLPPDLYLTVLDPSTADFKTSAREFLDRANAVILHEGPGALAWPAVSLKPVAQRPVFRIAAPNYVTREIVEFVRSNLRHDASRNRS